MTTIFERTELLNALTNLKNMCKLYKTCSECPVYDGVCKIKYTDPCDYELNTPEDPIWRAFKREV